MGFDGPVEGFDTIAIEDDSDGGCRAWKSGLAHVPSALRDSPRPQSQQGELVRAHPAHRSQCPQPYRGYSRRHHKQDFPTLGPFPTAFPQPAMLHFWRWLALPDQSHLLFSGRHYLPFTMARRRISAPGLGESVLSVDWGAGGCGWTVFVVGS